MTYRKHAESIVEVPVPAQTAFDFLDDQDALGAHMTESSAMMMGGAMSYEFDAQKGRAVGSVIRMRGTMLGLTLTVEEVITERAPPFRKVWETRGKQNMIVIDSYRMGFEIAEIAVGSRVRVFIEYDLARGWLRPLGLLLGPQYARWCIDRMAREVSKHFAGDGELERRHAVNT